MSLFLRDVNIVKLPIYTLLLWRSILHKPPKREQKSQSLNINALVLKFVPEAGKIVR